MPETNLILQNADWPATAPGVISHAVLRASPADFRVTEIPLTLPDGEGEHLWVRLQQTGWTTASAAKILSRWTDAPPRDISYAGRKDRNAITEQWFSVQLPGQPDPTKEWEWPEGLVVLEQKRHSRKLKTGALKGNRFTLVLREVEGNQAAVNQRLEQLKATGFPNYFGPQRFGRDGDNVAEAMKMFSGEKKVKNRDMRSTMLSAARSWVFNEVLANRIKQNSWNVALQGDLLNLSGSNSLFYCEVLDDETQQRVTSGDVSPTGPLPGKGGDVTVSDDAAAIEQPLLETYAAINDGLIKHRVNASRRALRVMPGNLCWEWLDQNTLQLDFELPPGSYATALVAELMPQ